MGNIRSISLTDRTLKKKILDLRYNGDGIRRLVAQGIVLAVERALYLSNIKDYKWELFDISDHPVDRHELQMFSVTRIVSRIEDILISTPSEHLGYSIWIIQNTNTDLQYHRYTVDTSFAMSSLLQGIMTMIKYFNLRISDVFAGKIIRLSIRDGQYIVNYFDIETAQLPMYNFTSQELARVYNTTGNGNNSLVVRLDNIRQHIIDRYRHREEIAFLLPRLARDAETILRYTLEETDNLTIAKYLEFIRIENRPLEDFLTTYELI